MCLRLSTHLWIAFAILVLMMIIPLWILGMGALVSAASGDGLMLLRILAFMLPGLYILVNVGRSAAMLRECEGAGVVKVGIPSQAGVNYPNQYSETNIQNPI